LFHLFNFCLVYYSDCENVSTNNGSLRSTGKRTCQHLLLSHKRHSKAMKPVLLYFLFITNIEMSLQNKKTLPIRPERQTLCSQSHGFVIYRAQTRGVSKSLYYLRKWAALHGKSSQTKKLKCYFEGLCGVFSRIRLGSV
jgi:hypothetical protein